MPWPMSQDYNEAIQNPLHSFADPELQRGEVVCNALGLPVPCSGNFADVYAVQSGQRKWAVKCFTREIPGLQNRYVQISKYLAQVQLPFMVEFEFLPRGIKVRGQCFPILKMQWVEGVPLNTFLRNHLENRAVLQILCEMWIKLVERLRQANMAHGDLQHGNILLVAGSRPGMVGIKLVDYDGTCVPALESVRSNEMGHPSYQHPQRLREGTYGLHIDRFSHLVIYTALRGLMVGGSELWERYDNGDNLLFRQSDFEAPRASPLFQHLLKFQDAELTNLVRVLAVASQNPIQQAPLLDALVAAGPLTATPSASGETPLPSWMSEPPPETPARTTAQITTTGTIPVPPRWKRKSTLVGLVGGLVVLAGVAFWSFNRTKEELSDDRTLPPTLTLELGDGKKLGLVLIKKGRCRMGSPSSDRDAVGEEKPDHELVIGKSFYMGRHLVTQEQYRKVVGTNPSHFSKDGDEKQRVEGMNTDRLPVENVSWADARMFCERASQLTGRRVELPTEAEWEYACRAGTNSRYYCGDRMSAEDANFNSNVKRTTEVGRYPKNPWGLTDMMGNVWQWCADGPRTYTSTPVTDPVGPDANGVRALRGGSWATSAGDCRCAYRHKVAASYRSNNIGFRVVVRVD